MAAYRRGYGFSHLCGLTAEDRDHAAERYNVHLEYRTTFLSR